MSTIQTRSGKMIDILNISVDDIDEHDIAHALSNLCRWGGHSKRFYSVAEHSWRVAELLSLQGATHEEQLAGLLHDATEAYVVDMPRPIKKILPDYISIENQIASVIEKKFCLTPGIFSSPVIKQVDDALLYREAWELMENPGVWAGTKQSAFDRAPVRTIRAKSAVYHYFRHRLMILRAKV